MRGNGVFDSRSTPSSGRPKSFKTQRRLASSNSIASTRGPLWGGGSCVRRMALSNNFIVIVHKHTNYLNSHTSRHVQQPNRRNSGSFLPTTIGLPESIPSDAVLSFLDQYQNRWGLMLRALHQAAVVSPLARNFSNRSTHYC